MSINKKKEELELMSNKDITNLLLEEKGNRTTAELYKEIIKLLGLPKSTFDQKIGDYYTALTTDKRFILLEDGTWDLKSRHTSDKLKKIEEDDDEELDDIKEEIEEEEIEEDLFDESDEDYVEDTNEDLRDLVILDEDELELEE